MKAMLPRHEHESYRRHRKQTQQQIILPLALVASLMLVLTVLLIVITARGGGEVSRWASISTIWVLLPVLVAGLVALAVLAGLIYLLARLQRVLPTYTSLAQDYVQLGTIYVWRFTDSAVPPSFAANGLAAYFTVIFGRK
jgi:uncharacterized membrane protein